MNEKDLKIIAYLRRNARMPLTRMSRKIQVPVSTIYDKLKLNEDNLIMRYTSLLDFTKLGYNIRVNMNLKVDTQDKDELQAFLMKHQSINSVYKINNGYDFMIEGVFRQMKDMEEFIEKIEKRFKIQDKKAYFIVDDLKREAFLSDPSLIFPE